MTNVKLAHASPLKSPSLRARKRKMPELLSGRRVGLSANNMLDLAREGDFTLEIGALRAIEEPQDVAPLVDVVEFVEYPDIPADAAG